MKVSKILIMSLSLLLVFSCLITGCAGSKSTTGTDKPSSANTEKPVEKGADESGTETALEPITFTMFSGDQDIAETDDNPIVQKLRELTGVTIEFEFLVGDLAQKMGVMIASGDYPDLMNPSQERNSAMEAGAFIPLEDMIPDYPNIYKHYEPYLDKMVAACGGEHIYLMDNYGRYYGDWRPTYQNGTGFWIQKDILEDAGYPIPKTVEEYFTLIENYAAKYPEIDGQPTVGFEVLSYDWRAFCLRNAPQHLVGNPNDGDVIVDQDTYVADLYQNKDYAKRYYQKLNELYHKGLIQVDTFTQNYDQYLAKISSGRVLGMFDQYWNFQDGERPLKEQGKWERTYVSMPIAYEGYTDWYLEAPTFSGGNGMGITVNCKDPERAMQYINMCLDPEIQKLLSWGIEGTNYFVDEDGMFYRTEEERQNQRDRNWVPRNFIKPLWAQFPKIQGIHADGNWVSPNEQPGEVLAEQSLYDQEFLGNYGFSLPTEFLSSPPAPNPPDYYPVWSYSLEAGSPAALALAKVQELEDNYLPRIIVEDADKFEDAWNEYVTMIEEESNYKAYLDEVNKQIKARMNMN